MFNNSSPTILIASGANLIGLKLTEILLEQGSNVIMLDEFDESKIHFAKHFRKNEKFKFLEQDSFDANKAQIKRLDYTFVLLYEKKIGQDNISSKNFIKISEFIDKVFEFTQYKKARSVLVTSIEAHKKHIEGADHERAYSFIEVQKHAEKIAKEYTDELNLNNRIVRVANVLGPQMNIEEDSEIISIMRESLTKDYITIYGDGLEYDYYIYCMDAVYGLVKAVFDDKTKDETLYLCGTEAISLLAMANKLLKCNVQANSIKFENKNIKDDQFIPSSFTLSNNMSELGWKPTIDIQRTLSLSLEYMREKMGIEKVIQNREHNNPNVSLSNFGFDEEPLLIKVKKVDRPLKFKNLKSHSKFKFLFLFLIILTFIGAFFMAILPITNTLSLSSEQTQILGEVNRSITKDKDVSSTNAALKKLNDSNGLDKLETRLKSLEFVTGLTGQKNSYEAFLKTFASYQYYIQAVEKIAGTQTISKNVYEGSAISTSDVLTIQTLTDIKNDLNSEIENMKNVSTYSLPHDTRIEVESMISISKDLLKKLTF